MGRGRHAKNLTGQTFSRLTALKRIGTKNGRALWECHCICGQTVNIPSTNLTSGNSRSCGCLRSREAKDLTGQTFGRLTVLGRVGTKWECLCSCGQTTKISAGSLVHGGSRSCGCLRSELMSTRMTGRGHGKVNTGTYKTWAAMRSRCNRPKDDSYKDYGGRGIRVCERWNDSFENFYSDMGDRPPGACIDRIDNNEGYAPANCRWSTAKEQANNTRRNIFFTYQGKIQTIPQWSEEYGLDRKVLWDRLNTLNWSIEKALTTPKK